MNIESMPLVGFEFFKEQFCSECKRMNIIKDLENTKKKKVIEQDENLQDDDPLFYVVDPDQITNNLGTIWKIALESKLEEVIDKSIGFLINCYLSLCPVLFFETVHIRNEKCQNLIADIFARITINQNN